MWNVVMLAVLMSVAGIYVTRNHQTVDRAEAGLAAGMAAEMGVYRGAVARYFSEHDLLAASVSTATLKSGGYLPPWSRMYQQSTPLIWSNYRDAGGVIYVYATSLPAQDLAGELARLAHNSVLLGVYRASAGTLHSPVAGDTGISLAALAGRAIPDGAPVWIATAP
jgi:hypothetical protein